MTENSNANDVQAAGRKKLGQDARHPMEGKSPRYSAQLFSADVRFRPTENDRFRRLRLFVSEMNSKCKFSFEANDGYETEGDPDGLPEVSGRGNPRGTEGLDYVVQYGLREYWVHLADPTG